MIISVNRCQWSVTVLPLQFPGTPSSWHSCEGSAWGNVIRWRFVTIEISALTLRQAFDSDSRLSSWDVESVTVSGATWMCIVEVFVSGSRG